MAKKTCTSKRCVSKLDSERYAKAKKERRRLQAKLNALLSVDERRFGTDDLALWSMADFIDATPPSPTNICAGMWASAMIAVAAYYDCIAGQIEV